MFLRCLALSLFFERIKKNKLYYYLNSIHFEMTFSKNRFKVRILACPAQAVASLPIFWNAPLVVQFFNIPLTTILHR